MKAIKWLLIILAFLPQQTSAYIQIQLQIATAGDMVTYSIPAKINGVDYHMAISLENKEQYIVPILVKAPKKMRKKLKFVKQLTCQIDAVSMQNYSFEGWIRFIKHALLFIEGHYAHNMKFPLSNIRQLSKQSTMYPHDALLTFGPSFSQNIFYGLIKESKSSAISNDIVSFYKKSNGKNALLQFGGVQEKFGKVQEGGVQFYEFQLFDQNDKWMMPVEGISCVRMGKGTQKYEYNVPESSMNMAISLQRRGIKFPMSISEQITKNFETVDSQCHISDQQRLVCKSIPQSMLLFYWLQIKITATSYLQFPLSSLILKRDKKNNETQFCIEFTENDDNVELGEVLFHNYYVSIDLQNRVMKYSKINYFQKEVQGVHLLRVAIGLLVFCVVVAVVARFWGGLAGHTHGAGKGSYHQLYNQEEIYR